MRLGQSKVYIYGAGKEYNRVCSYLGEINSLKIEGIITTQRNRYRFIDGYPCICVEEADFDSVDYVIVSVAQWREIYEILLSYRVNPSKIILSRVFGTPFFVWDDYIRLKKSNVTLISNSCLGGMIYKELGLRFNTPTIQSGCFYDGFFDFAGNLKDFLAKPMQIHYDETYNYNGIGRERFFPKGIITDSKGCQVEFLFPHTSSAELAVDKWNNRKERVNYENVAIAVIITNDSQLERFNELKIEKKIGVYYKKSDIEGMVFCDEWNDKELRFANDYNWPKYGNTYLINSRGSAAAVDWIKFLNGERGFLRYEF